MQTLGTINLPTVTAANLFQNELQGQFSDGMWENSGPHGHWKFWCSLEVKVVPTECRVVTDRSWDCKKTGYSIASLYDIIGDRMVALGRMARALDKVLDYDLRVAAEEMPATYQEFLTKLRETGSGTNRLGLVSDEMAQKFYSTTYTMKDLRNDVRVIKQAMKTVAANRY